MATRKQSFVSVFNTPIGRVRLLEMNDRLQALELVSSRTNLMAPATSVVREACNQLNGYFSNPDCLFKLDLMMEGTPFQKRVWRELVKIPSGKVTTYGKLAKHLGTSPRAVGNACRANPLPIIVPCHRVVASTGVGGYMGKTAGRRLEIKSWLLDHESRQ